MGHHLDSASQARLDALSGAPLDRWIALSEDESRVIADADTFEAVVEAAQKTGEADPLIIRVPEDWAPRVL